MVLLFCKDSESGNLMPFSGGQNFKAYIRCKVFEFHGEQWNALLGGEGLLEFRMAAIYSDSGSFQIDGNKKWEPLDVVPMDVG